MAITPYIFFTGTCREAMTEYQRILGGELELMTAAEMPEGEEPPPGPPNPDMIIHAALTLDDGALLMASDDPTGDGSGVKGAAVSVTYTDAAQARQVFDQLCEGGEVSMAMGETFWSPNFGMCVDRFGMSWMIDVEAEEGSAS